MLEIFGLTKEAYKLYAANGMHIALFLAALIALACLAGEKEIKKLFVGYSVIFFVIYFCPLTAKIIMDYCIGRDVYWRMFWILPIPMILSYTGVRALRVQTKKLFKVIMLAALVIVVAVTGYMVYTPGSVLQKAENLQKIPSAASAVCEIISNDRKDGELSKAAVPEDLVGYIRQYDASIGLAYGRKGYKSNADKKIYAQMTAEKANFKKLIRAVRKAKCNYLVYFDAGDNQKRIEKLNFKAIGKTNGYVIYKDINNA